MKTLILILTVLLAVSFTSCSTHVRNHSGIREWKAGKQKTTNRRAHERPQCIDSW